jgi:RNA polymerase sigma factor (sigma-70 family)
MNADDRNLLREYAERRSQDAFARLVNRHLNLVYSAALRIVRSPQLAEEVAQSVFTDLARNADKVKPDTVLSAWLYRVAYRTAVDIVRRESRRQNREQQAAELAAMYSESPEWTRIEPLLDEGMQTLDETDRAAVLLRYFEGKSLREVGQALGTNEDAAQKRVSRAVERLREFFGKRGVAVGAGGLVVVISANAVQAATVGLAAAISSAATLAGTAITTAATATKVITMTTLQKSLVTAAVIAAAGTGIYEAREASILRSEVETLQQSQTVIGQRVQQLTEQRDEASNRLAVATESNTLLNSDARQAELVQLRSEVAVLRKQLSSGQPKTDSTSPASGLAKLVSDPVMKQFAREGAMKEFKLRYAPFAQALKLTPEQTEKFIDLFTKLWFDIYMTPDTLPGNPDPAKAAQTVATAKADIENQMLALLGDSGFEQFKEFTLEVPARATLDLLYGQLGDKQLTDDQTSRLFQILKAEPYELTHGIEGDVNNAFFGSQSRIDDYLRRLAESNQRVLQQAGSFLTPEQLAVLNSVLVNGVKSRQSQAAALLQNPRP